MESVLECELDRVAEVLADTSGSGGPRARVPRQWLLREMVDLLRAYPTGLSIAARRGELQAHWRALRKAQCPRSDAHAGVTGGEGLSLFGGAQGTSCDAILRTRACAIDAVIQVAVLSVRQPREDVMPVLQVADVHARGGVNQPRRALAMFLHQRFHKFLGSFLPAASSSIASCTSAEPCCFRFTGCRTVVVRGDARLLPTDLGVIVLMDPTLLFPPPPQPPPQQQQRQFGPAAIDRTVGRVAALSPHLETRAKRVCVEAQRRWDMALEAHSDPLASVLTAGLALAPQPVLNVVGKVAHIGPVQRAHVFGRQKCVIVILIDQSCPRGVELVLWDDQVLLANLFHKGDRLAVCEPYLPGRVSAQGLGTMEYGSTTLITCLVSAKRAVEFPERTLEAPGTQDPATSGSGDEVPSVALVALRDERGIVDCGLYADLLQLAHFVSRAVNATLLVRVLYVHPASTAADDSVRVRVADASGACDVFFFNRCVASARRLRPGDIVLLNGISTTSVQKLGGARLFSVECENGIIVNVSALSGLVHLQEESFLNFPSSASATSGIAKACITAWSVGSESAQVIGPHVRAGPHPLLGAHPPSNGSVVMAHKACRRPLVVQQGALFCAFCVADAGNHDFVFAFNIAAVLDDGTGCAGCVVEADVADAVLGALLEMQARDFIALSDFEQRVTLGRLVGREVAVAFVRVPVDGDPGINCAGATSRGAGVVAASLNPQQRARTVRVTAAGVVGTAAACHAILHRMGST